MNQAFKSLVIGEFEESDFESCALLFQQVYSEAYPSLPEGFKQRARFRSILQQGKASASHFWTAKNAVQLVGFCVLLPNFLDQLYIANEYQHQGLGTFWLEEAKRRYPEQLELYTLASNIGAIKFYEKNGFKVKARGIAPDEKVPDILLAWP
jgi:ribosomal protein S18 acetylase RimI-like enzyme